MTDIAQLQAASIRRVVGPTIILGSGNYFDFEDPFSTPLTIEDVAYGLGYTCRFAGQTYSKRLARRIFYAVAQHCVLISYQVPAHLAYDALMHELGEATCGDMTGPLKSIVPAYKVIEKMCARAAELQFGVTMREPDVIKLHDLRMLATERRDVTNWRAEDDWENIGGAKPYDMIIEPMPPDEAAEAFLQRYYELRHEP